MQKKLLFLCLIISIIVTSIVLNNNRSKLNLTNEERDFIKANEDTIFLVGYYCTPSEDLFVEKLCDKIEEDTSLKLKPYEDTWDNNLFLIEKGSLPILINMNKTEKREEFCYFTSELESLSAGIYSTVDNKINSYNDIDGKVLAIEKGVFLLNDFKLVYPHIQFDVIEYDTLFDMRQALINKEVDGFISTKSYDSVVKGMYYFEIPSISTGNNHIGVSKDYEVLYSVLSKEVDYLKQQKWDTLVSDVINFELEKTLLDYTESEVDYLLQKKVIVVGLPTEYFLYVHGEEYNTKGILSKILEKIEFILDIDFVYRFDSLENLRLRSDIDFYIDNTSNKGFTSTPIFNDKIVIVGSPDKKIINELYDLSSYSIGILGVPNAKNYLLEQMPKINIKEYTDFDIASRDIKNEVIDYLIVPKLFLSSVKYTTYLTHRGEFKTDTTTFVSDDYRCIKILNKCLSIIDINKIINAEMISLTKHNRPVIYVVCLCVLLLLLYVIKIIHKEFINKYYIDNTYGLYNIKHLKKQLKEGDVYLILFEINDAYNVICHYGVKIYVKYVNKILGIIKKNLTKTENIYYIEKNKFLIVKNSKIHECCSSLNSNEELIINKVILSLDINICYIQHLQNEKLENSLDMLHAGIVMAKDKNELIYLDNEEQNLYRNRIARLIKVKNTINTGQTNLAYKSIVDIHKNLFGKYAKVEIQGIKHRSLYKSIERLGLETKFDKEVINTIIRECSNTKIILDISEKTLVSDNFFKWLNSKLDDKRDITLYFLIKFECYERNIDIFETSDNIKFIIADFGNDLKTDCLVKYYDLEYLLLDYSLSRDIEENGEILNFIQSFAKNNHKKIISKSRLVSYADYFLEEEYDENTNR